MTGVLVGLVAGLGLFLVLLSLTEPYAPVRSAEGPRDRPSRTRRLEDLLAEAGLATVTPLRFLAASLGAGAVGLLLMMVVSRSLVIAAMFGAAAAYAPTALVRRRRRQRQAELRAVWPDVVDNLTSSVRAGLALPEALAQIGERGPAVLRGPFRRFARDYSAEGRFGASLDLLKADLADPVGDRIVEALRVARDVGGSDLGRLLRTLSAFLREDARTRGELEARQSWTVNGARMAVAAPWVLLALLSLRPQAVAAYNTSAGAVILLLGAGLCAVAYRVMLRIGRLPEDRRVLG